MNNNVRELHTGFYSDRAELIMRRLLEGEQSYQSSLKKTFKVKSILHLEVERAIDNEVVFTCGRFRGRGWDYMNSFDRINDTDALNHIAWCFKQCVLRCLRNELFDEGKAEESWNRSSTLKFRIETLDDVTVSEAYFIYDHLCQRKNAAKRYSKELGDSLIGLPLDPIMTQMKLGMLEEIERLKKEQEQTVVALFNEKEEAVKKYRDEKSAEFNKARDAVYAETEAKIAKINAELAAMTPSFQFGDVTV